MKICKKIRTGPELNQSKSWVMGCDKGEGVPKSTEEEGDPLQTQQSNAEIAEKEGDGGEVCEEELVDYDEDPAIVEKIEMAELEKKVESRAQVLLDKAAVKIPVETAMTGGIEEAMMGGRGNGKDQLNSKYR
jgi:hypothetical protein